MNFLKMGLISMFLLLPSAMSQAQTPQAKAPSPGVAVPGPEVLLLLVRSALIALDHANKTGNYSVLRELGGPALQAHSSGQLSNLFANLRSQNVDLLPAAVVTPQLTRPPSISPQDHLILAGTFPTQPQNIAFDIVYQPVQGQWRLFGMNVALSAPGAAAGVATAPAEKAPAAPTTKTAAPNAKKAAPAAGGAAPAR